MFCRILSTLRTLPRTKRRSRSLVVYPWHTLVLALFTIGPYTRRQCVYTFYDRRCAPTGFWQSFKNSSARYLNVQHPSKTHKTRKPWQIYLLDSSKKRIWIDTPKHLLAAALDHATTIISLTLFTSNLLCRDYATDSRLGVLQRDRTAYSPRYSQCFTRRSTKEPHGHHDEP